MQLNWHDPSAVEQMMRAVVECSPCAIETTPQGDHRGLMLDE